MSMSKLREACEAMVAAWDHPGRESISLRGEAIDKMRQALRSPDVAWLLIIREEMSEPIEAFASWESAFDLLFAYVQEQW